MPVAHVCGTCAEGWTLPTPPWTASYTTDGGRSWRFMLHYRGLGASRRKCPQSDQSVPPSAERVVYA